MGITERHWFEDEEPELTDRQLEDAVYDDKKIVRCKDCKHWRKLLLNMDGDGVCQADNTVKISHSDWFCADGKKKNS